MASTRIDHTTMEWSSGVPFYGPAAVHDGKDIVQLKVLSDRRKEGGGIAWLVKMTPPSMHISFWDTLTRTSTVRSNIPTPPPGKLIKIMAVALSDEHIFSPAGRPQHQGGGRAQGSGRLRLLEPQGPALHRPVP